MRTMNRLSICLLLAAAFFNAPEARAQSLALRNSPRLMQGVRPLGMGGAFAAVKGTDENAIFYNPAAINDYEKKAHMQFLLPSVEFSYKSIDFFSNELTDLIDDISDDAASDSDRVNALDAFAARNTGRYEEVALRGAVASFMHKYVTASLFYENRSVLALLNPAASELTVESASHAGLQLGTAFGFFDDHLQAGLAVKLVERHLISETVTRRDVIDNDDFGDSIEFRRFGFGVGGDIGLKGRLPIKNVKAWDYLDPVFAVTLQDVGDTRFFAGDDVGRLEQSLTFGFALHPDFGKFKSTLAVDFRDLDRRTDFITKLYAGYELTWPEISKVLRSASIRVGASQGYVTGGLGLDFKYFKINAATYGREIGQTTRQKQSRMMAVQLAAGF